MQLLFNMQNQDFQEERKIRNEELFRVQGGKTEDFIHRSIGALISHKGKDLVAGSGFLISNNLVMTAAHNVYDRQRNQENKNFQFYLGIDGVTNTYYEVEDLRYPSEYKTCQASKRSFYDFALLKLKKGIQFSNGFFDSIFKRCKSVEYYQYLQLWSPCLQCMMKENSNIKISIFGFPSQYKDNYKPLDQSGKKGLFINMDQPNRTGLLITLKGIKFAMILTHKMDKVDVQLLQIRPQQQFIQVERKINNLILVGLLTFSQSKDLRYGVNLSMQVLLEFNPKTLVLISKPNKKKYLKEKQERVYRQTIKQLNLSSQQLKQINIGEYISITELSLSKNQLSRIDVSQNTNLTELYLHNNKISSIDISKNTKLTVLYLSDNQLSAIDITKNTNLAELYLYNNQLSSINICKNISLTHLYLSNNRLIAINASQNTQLVRLQLQNNCLKVIQLPLVVSKSVYDYMSWFDFSHQLSTYCQIQIHNLANKFKCDHLKNEWVEKYGEKGENKHGCKYTFTIVEYLK